MMIDITDQKTLEEKVRHTQKLEAVGRLAGGIAHDFNNVLGIIAGYGELLAGNARNDQKMTKYANNILDAVKRGAGLTRQLLAFSKNQPFQKSVFEVDPALKQMVNLLQPLLGEDIILSIAADS